MSNRLDVAVSYAQREWKCLILQPNGKAPAGRTGSSGATDDLVTIRQWFGSPKDYNIGINCSASGLFVVDCDIKPDKGPAGISSWLVLCERFRTDWESTYCVVTPSGGLHIYWATNLALRNSESELAINIDTKGNNNYVVAAGSVIDGVEYEHFGGDVPLSIPEWLEALFKPRPPETREGLERRIDYDRRSTNDQRENARAGLLRTIGEALLGERNNTLNWDAYKIATKFWPLEERESLLDEVRMIALEIGLTESEIESTMRSARRAMS